MAKFNFLDFIKSTEEIHTFLLSIIFNLSSTDKIKEKCFQNKKQHKSIQVFLK